MRFSQCSFGFLLHHLAVFFMKDGKEDREIAACSSENFMAGVFVAFGCLLFAQIIPELHIWYGIIFRRAMTV